MMKKDYTTMVIHYLVNPELGWDNVCGMGTSLKNAVQDFCEDEDFSDLTDEELENYVKENVLVYLTRTITIKFK